MKLDIYRIDTSLAGKAFRIVRKPDLPTLATTGMLGDNLFQAIRDYFSGDNFYILSREEEIKRFEFPLKRHKSKKIYYIRHPHKDRELIESAKFFEYVTREQLAEIISYIRSYIDVSYIRIERKSGIEFNTFINSPIDDIPVEGKVEINFSSKDILEIKCPNKLKPSERKRNFVWIDEFPGIKELVDCFNGGEASRYIERSQDYGLTIKIADRLGIGSKWIKGYKLKIDFQG
ncbi:hypothetical protein [Natronospora cellulosivora (SeqCode)]